MKKIFSFLCLAFVTMSLSADRLVTEIWPSVPPTDVKLQKGSLEQTMGDDQILRISKMPRPTLELFEVKKSKKKQVIIICPGGGYNILAVNHEGTEIAQWLNSLGYTAYILRYRVPNEREGALQDAQRAIRLVRSAHPDKQVGIMGFSASGHLASSVSTHAEAAVRPDFSILFYPVISMDERISHKGSCVKGKENI